MRAAAQRSRRRRRLAFTAVSQTLLPCSPLSRCWELQSLDLSNSAVRDVAPLGTLRQLHSLQLNQTSVASVSALQVRPGP